MEATTKTWAPEIRGEDGPDPVSAVYQAIGAASMCWESMAGTGVFDDGQAHAIAEGLVAYLRENPLSGAEGAQS